LLEHDLAVGLARVVVVVVDLGFVVRRPPGFGTPLAGAAGIASF
jgi:hypothetical protein